MLRMKINYFNRGVNSGHSIQRVFGVITGEVQRFEDVHIYNVPEIGTSIKTFIKNFAFVKAHRDLNSINHVTGDVNYLALVLGGYKCVVTVHDIGLMKRLKGIKKMLWKFWWIESLKKADKVTFISTYTKNEVLKYVNLPESKMRVIPNPVPSEFTYTHKEFNLTKPIILHIGAGANKNLINSIEAIKGISCHVRIIGKIDSRVINLLEEYGIEYSTAANLTDNQILEEYKMCDIVNFPSLHEGFGMPILEGQAVGRVVLSSDIAPMNEVCGNGGAFLVNPYDITSIRNGYKKLIHDADLRNQIIQRGTENVKKFSAKAIAELYVKMYKEIY